MKILRVSLFHWFLFLRNQSQFDSVDLMTTYCLIFSANAYKDGYYGSWLQVYKSTTFSFYWKHRCLNSGKFLWALLYKVSYCCDWWCPTLSLTSSALSSLDYSSCCSVNDPRYYFQYLFHSKQNYPVDSLRRYSCSDLDHYRCLQGQCLGPALCLPLHRYSQKNSISRGWLRMDHTFFTYWVPPKLPASSPLRSAWWSLSKGLAWSAYRANSPFLADNCANCSWGYLDDEGYVMMPLLMKTKLIDFCF